MTNEMIANYLRLDEDDSAFELCVQAAKRYVLNAAGIDPDCVDDPEVDMLVCQLTGEFYENRSYLSEKSPHPGWVNYSTLLHIQSRYDTGE